MSNHEDPTVRTPAPESNEESLQGWAVLHLFYSVSPETDSAAVEKAIRACKDDEHQVITATMLGHKADLAVLGIGPSPERLRQLQTEITQANCTLTYSYVSLTEVSEYAAGVPIEMKHARLRPVLPPTDMPAFCFYPMSKRRDATGNWYLLSFDERMEFMRGHGAIGRTFHGRVLQFITGSTGLDDYEWGVTLFAKTADDLKDCIYTMRFDEASAIYADFGAFLYGNVVDPGTAMTQLGLR